jgi:hypothetical protein
MKHDDCSALGKVMGRLLPLQSGGMRHGLRGSCLMPERQGMLLCSQKMKDANVELVSRAASGSLRV